jgi:hypothetical protein
MIQPATVLRKWCLQLVGVLGLSGGILLLLATGANADNCDLRINPEDCQNTAWTVGTAGAIAAAAAVAAAVAASKPEQVNGSEWVHAHFRAVASDAQGSDVAAVELQEGQSPPTAVIRIVPLVDAGTQGVEEIDE